MAHIFLVGFMGAGKSTVGAMLAAREGLAFVDLDDAIERESGAPAGALLRERGEPAFRALESEALERLAASSGPSVIACGGGAVLREANVALMRSAGTVVWLRADAETCRRRASSGVDRPLLDGRDDDAIHRLLLDRTPRYAEAADAVVETEGLDAAEVVEAVAKALEALHG